MSKGEESTIPADGIKALSQEKKCEVNYISFKPKPKRERENAVVEQSDDKTISVMEKGADYMSIPTEDHIVEIDGPKVGQALARHPGVHLVSLTGGTAAGIQTMGTCSQNLTHVMLELGGNDAFIFLEDGDMDLAIKETIWGRLYNGGQVCCASKRFLIHNSRKAEFIEKMKEVISNLKVGDPTKEDTDMGPMININAAKRIEEQVNKTVAEGAKIVCGGKREDAYYYPTILDNVTKDMEVAKDMEIFGPVISVIGFDTVEEAIEIANQSSYGLCGCVITRDYSLGMKVADKLECGGAIVNGASFYRSFEMP